MVEKYKLAVVEVVCTERERAKETKKKTNKKKQEKPDKWLKNVNDVKKFI